MKNRYTTKWLSPLKRGLLVAVCVLFTGTMAMAQLSGTYTIDSANTTSGTNFQSFTDFASAINTNGVKGAVTVNVVSGSGPYEQSVSFGAISGANSSNTITINGNGETIRNTASSYVIQMNGADYFTFNNLKVDAAGTGNNTRCFHFYNGADYNTVKNSELIISQYTGTSNSTSYIAFSGSTSGNSAGNHGSNNTFDNNKMWNGGSSTAGPYYGVSDYRSSSYYNTLGNNRYTNNEVRDVYYYFFYFYYCNGNKILKNKIHDNRSNASYCYTVYLYYCNTTSEQVQVNGNEFYNLKATNYVYAPYIYRTPGTSSLPVQMNNNKFHDNDANYMYGFRMYYYCDNSEVKFNEHYNNDASYYNYYGVQCYYSSNTLMEGNQVHNNTAGYYMYYGIYFYYCTNSKCINNAYYNNDASNGNLYCLYNGYCDNSIIAHNTWIVNDDVDHYNYIWYVYYYNTPNNLQIKNNIMSFKSKTGYGYQYPIYCYYNTDKIDWASNVIHDNSSGTKYYYGNSTNYSSFTNWLNNATNDNSSMAADPKFKDLSKGDITPTNPEISNIGVQGLATMDLNGNTRTACGPDPGALEFTVDHNASNFTFTGTDECGGYQEAITFDFQNGTSVSMSNVRVFYQINSEDPVVEEIATVGASAKVTYTFESIPEFHEPGVNTITVGLLCDDDTKNNTLTKTIKITPAPHSFEYSEGANFEGYYRLGASGGTMSNPDVIVPGKQAEYVVENPTAYSTSTYGTGWDLTPTLFTSGGVAVTSGYTYTAPSGSNKGMITFDPATSLVDSLVFVGLTASDYKTGCDSLFGRWVLVPQYPTVDWTSSKGCDGEVISFSNSSSMGHGLIEYTWDFDDPASGAENNTSTISDPVHLFSTYGTYDVTVTAWNYEYPKFTYTLTKQVDISPVPDVCFKVKNACEGENIEFLNCTTAPVAGSINYIWNFGDGTTPSTLKDPKHAYANAGGYQVTLTASLNGCATSLTKNANQFATPTADFTVDGLCNLEDVKFVNGTTIALGNSGFRWDFGDGSISNLANPTHAFADPGSHTVKLKAISEFGCEDEADVMFNLEESPKADFDFTDACNLKEIEFSRMGSLPSGNSIFQWDFDGEMTSTQENPKYLFNTVGVKKVSLMISSDNGCSDMISKEFVVKLQAQADFVATDVCEGDEVVFTNKSTVASGNLNYTWRFGDGNNSGLTSPRHGYELQTSGETESFQVTLVAIVPGGCSDSIAKTVTVNATSDPSFAFTTNGREVTFTPTTAEATNVYNWRFGDGGRSGDVSPTYEYVNIDEGTFNACLSIINNAGCESESCQDVTISLSGIEDITNTVFSVYPNPNNGQFNVQLSNPQDGAQITIMDAQGKIIRTLAANGTSSTYGVDMTDVAAGVYLVQVTNGSTVATERVTISK